MWTYDMERDNPKNDGDVAHKVRLSKGTGKHAGKVGFIIERLPDTDCATNYVYRIILKGTGEIVIRGSHQIAIKGSKTWTEERKGR